MTIEKIPTYCALCVSRCGAVATVEDGRFIALEPDPTHPTGKALCIKGRVAPELVDDPERLTHPIKRTRPKGDPDPGWQRISWDEALDLVAAGLRRLADEQGPETVVFSSASASTTAIVDSAPWIQRLRKIYGSPNYCGSMELCGWGRHLANLYSYGVPLPGGCPPDIENAGCILFWGYNPSASRIAHATQTVATLKRGAKLVVVDPRQAGLASRAQHWLQVRPGTDGGLALGLAHVMIARGWYDRDFLRNWTNAPFLVRADTGRLLRASDVAAGGRDDRFVVWDAAASAVADYDPDCAEQPAGLALSGRYEVETLDGLVACAPAFQLVADLCASYPPAEVERLTGVAATDIEATAETLWQARPVAYNAWSGVEQQSNATQIARAIALVYTLTGSFDAKGGNVMFPAVPQANVAGADLLPSGQVAKALGLPDRPLGPSRYEHINSAEVYRAILDRQPYPVRGLLSFGSNLLLAHADGETGRRALQQLDFHVHCDLFLNPSAAYADVVLPVASAFETEGLKLGFEISEEACSLVQLRRPVAAPRGEARSDVQIVFDLACRLGYGAQFWHGDIDAAYAHQLAPSGLRLAELRDRPAGIRVPLQTRYRKYAGLRDGVPAGFATPSRRVEIYSETMLAHGYPALPVYEPPLIGPTTQPDLAGRFPLLLTCAKDTIYCESQHRSLPSLRRRAPDPQVYLHPEAAAARDIRAGDWVAIETPNGRTRARASLDATLDPHVVSGHHGWWQACPEIGAEGYPATGPDNANFNLVIGHADTDPVSGSVPMRAYLCQVRPLN